MNPKPTGNADIQIGQAIRSARLMAGLSQTALAEHLGVTFQQVQKYEKGANRISAPRLQAVSVALGVPVADLLGLSDAVPGEPPRRFTAEALRVAADFDAISSVALREHITGFVRNLAREEKSPRASG